MKKEAGLILSVMIGMAAGSAYAQQALGSKAAVASPEINADKTVTFRLPAKNAKEVLILGDCVADNKWIAPMTMSQDSIWEYTTPRPLDSELYMYNFIVDGVKINDPSNVYMCRDIANVMNIFIVDGNGDNKAPGDRYKVQNVKHGSLHKVWYDSKSMDMQRRMTVYTPAGYEEGTKRYPVFYLLHGMGGDENAWTELGRAAQILDNMIASGEVEPMIVVMTNGNAGLEATPGESSLGFVQPFVNLPEAKASFAEHFPEVVAFIDKNYRTKADKKHRAIAGLSMGGGHSFDISKCNPDMFDYVGLFSAAVRIPQIVGEESDDVLKKQLTTQFSKKPALYYIAIGKDDFLYDMNKEYRKMLDDMGFKYVYRESEDGHIWRNWRMYLTEFLPMLFRNN